MGYFFFHLKKGADLVQDEEGIELPSVDEARRLALQTARELLADAIKFGKAKIPDAVVIADEIGQPVEVIPVAAVLPDSLRR
jgi:hypothetical protein